MLLYGCSTADSRFAASTQWPSLYFLLHAAESSLHAADDSLHAAGSLRPAASSVTASCRGALLACHHNPPTVCYAIVVLNGYSIRCHPLLPLPSPLPYARKVRTPTTTRTWQPPALPIYSLFYAIC